MWPLVQIALQFPVVSGYLLTPWSWAGGSDRGEVVEPGARDSEEVGGLGWRLRIWLLS